MCALLRVDDAATHDARHDGLMVEPAGAPCAVTLLLQRMDAKMDSLVTLVADVRRRMVALSDLPAQLQAGLKAIATDIKGVRSLVLAVRLWSRVWHTADEIMGFSCHSDQ
jgi:hypothetical protein